MEDLSELIVKEACHCLNDSPGKPFSNVFIGDERLVCESDNDEQLLMTFEFRESVRLHSINIVAPSGDGAPLNVKLFVNQASIGFSDCDGPCAQAFELSMEDVNKERVCELKMTRFSYVNSISIFVEDNHGADVTEISSIKFIGCKLQGTNMAEFKKQGC